MVRCREGKSPYRVFHDKIPFFKQGTIQCDQLLLLALESDSFTGV